MSSEIDYRNVKSLCSCVPSFVMNELAASWLTPNTLLSLSDDFQYISYFSSLPLFSIMVHFPTDPHLLPGPGVTMELWSWINRLSYQHFR